MGQIDVQIVIQLWQIAFAAIMGCGSLVAIGFAAATVFVRRSDCHSHIDSTTVQLKGIYDLMREVKADVDILKGRMQEKR